MLAGNLAIDINVPDQLQLDNAIDSALDGVIAKSLNSMNFIIMIVMFLVAIFYALSSLYNERQDDSVLFWRSLPISDSLTVASKLMIALLVIPLIIIICQACVAIVFFGFDSINYLSGYYGSSFVLPTKIVLWSMLPVISWCLLCSAIAKKNPFLLAFIAPILFIVVDKLFFNGALSETFIINRLTGISHYTATPLISGLLFSAACFVLAVIKRSQRI